MERRSGSRGNCWCIIGIILLAVSPCAPAEELSSRAMLIRMLDALAVPEGYQGTMTVQSSTQWTGSPQVGPEYGGSYSDVWEFLRQEDRVGKESHRELPDGSRCSRMVKNGVDFQSIELGPDHERAIQVNIWSGLEENPSWAMPVLDYLDPGFPAPHELKLALDNGFPKPELVSVDGVPCYHIRFAWRRRQVEVWLDPEFNYLPRQYHLRLDYWHNIDLRNARGASRDPQRPIRERMKVPEFLEDALGRPLTSEERMVGVVLDRVDGVPFIKRASIEKTMQLGDGISHIETLTVEQEPPRSLENPESARAFLDFEGLIPNETPVTLRASERREPVELVWRDGDVVPRHGPIATVTVGAWRRMQGLVEDFSFERIRQMDTWVIAVFCAVVAAVINGALVLYSRRQRRIEPPTDLEGTE